MLFINHKALFYYIIITLLEVFQGDGYYYTHMRQKRLAGHTVFMFQLVFNFGWH